VKNKSPRRGDAKIEEGIIVGPQIREFILISLMIQDSLCVYSYKTQLEASLFSRSKGAFLETVVVKDKTSKRNNIESKDLAV
jgi:hypothetical protein